MFEKYLDAGFRLKHFEVWVFLTLKLVYVFGKLICHFFNKVYAET